jgi:O-antigen/teichoic acid export membrane protein
VKKLPFNLSNKDSLSRKLVEATLGGAGVRIAGMGLTFLVGVQLARQLGPEGYGVYGTVMAIVAILMVPAQLGLTNLATRDVSVAMTKGSNDNAKGALVWFSLSTCAASLIVCAIGILILVRQTHPASLNAAYLWGLACIPALSLCNLGVAFLRGFRRVLTAQVYDALFRPLLFAGLLFAATISVGLDPATALAMQTGAAVLTLVFTAHKLHSIVSPEIVRAKAAAHWRNWSHTALSMAGTEVVRALEGQYAVLLFGLLASLSEVGVFRVAVATVGFVCLPSTLINLIVAPFIAQLYEDADLYRLQMVANGAVSVTFLSACIATIASASTGDIALALVFGESYRNAWAPLTLLSLGYAVNGFFGSTATILNMTGHEKTVTSSYALGVGIGIMACLCLFPVIGVNSAGVALILSEIVKGTMMRRVAIGRLGVDTSIVALIKCLASFAHSNTAKQRVSTE